MSDAQLTWAILAVVVAAVVPIVILARCYGRTEQSVKMLHDALFNNDGDNKLDTLRIELTEVKAKLNNGYISKVDRLCGDMDMLKGDMTEIKHRVSTLDKL